MVIIVPAMFHALLQELLLILLVLQVHVQLPMLDGDHHCDTVRLRVNSFGTSIYETFSTAVGILVGIGILP